MKNFNLPPGCTERDIEESAGDYVCRCELCNRRIDTEQYDSNNGVCDKCNDKEDHSPYD